MKHIAFLLMMAGTPVFASCPASPDIAADLQVLIAQANGAENEAVGREASGEMWKLWLKAPDETAQEMLDRGMRARAEFDFLGAVQTFNRLVEYCPEYAEGFNQRAFAFFLQEDFEKAMTDLDVALKLSPNHVGAQSGRALTLMNLGRMGEARLQLQGALKNNPWLSERFLLAKGGPLAPQGEDI